MRQRGQVVGQDSEADAELTLRAAAGDLAAFEELYRRHVEAAWRVALAVTANPDDAADAVSDAFTRVFQALPDRLQAADYFLPYLLVAVRNAAIDVLRRGGRQRVTDPNEAYDWSVLGAEPAELMVAGADATLVARAFRGLPERWRSVLWLTEVEGIPAREVAGLLGVSANGVAQLAVRARAGLRQRYLQAHLHQTEVRTSCRETVDRLGAYAAGALAPRDISKVDQHLAGCETCRSRLDQLEDLAPALRRAVLPLPAALGSLVLGKWGAAFSGASGGTGASGASSATATAASSATLAGVAGPVGIGVGAVAVGVPASFATSFASVALLVVGIVGVGVLEHQREAPPAAVAAAPEVSFAPAAVQPANTRPSSAADDPIAGLVDEGNRAAADLAALTDNLVGSLPGALPEVAPPDAAELERIAQGQLSVDVKATSISADVTEGRAMCPSMRVLGAHVGCQSPDAPDPGSEATAVVAATEEAAARAHDIARERTEAITPLPPS